jgi:hypothetical protein
LRITGFSNRVLKKEPQQMVVLRFFGFHPVGIKGSDPDSATFIYKDSAPDAVLKKTQDRQFSPRNEWFHKWNIPDVRTFQRIRVGQVSGLAHRKRW